MHRVSSHVTSALRLASARTSAASDELVEALRLANQLLQEQHAFRPKTTGERLLEKRNLELVLGFCDHAVLLRVAALNTAFQAAAADLAKRRLRASRHPKSAPLRLTCGCCNTAGAPACREHPQLSVSRGEATGVT